MFVWKTEFVVGLGREMLPILFYRGESSDSVVQTIENAPSFEIKSVPFLQHEFLST